MDIISEHIDNMTLDQLKHNARAALVAEACRKADVEEISDDREFVMDRALNGVKVGAVRITWPAYEEAVLNSEKADDVAAANWARRLLNIVPLTDEWEEQDPKTFAGYLGDHHTLPKPPPEVCDNPDARMPWVQLNLLHGPRPDETPEYRGLAEAHRQATLAYVESPAGTRGEREERQLLLNRATDAATAENAYLRRRLADLATFTALLPDELFIP